MQKQNQIFQIIESVLNIYQKEIKENQTNYSIQIQIKLILDRKYEGIVKVSRTHRRQLLILQGNSRISKGKLG
ncbi:unnamed protein product [Paramecium sonneborni]|uniref:Uncharacterized protein n=1 Tax=Paramecium sonneborni TaxID=65129 RepID=A0A8S1R100_9CILI|nr:unnamed protein product [Paramecium sonneborni]